MENTIPDPAKQRRKVVEEGGEVVTKRYQDRTNNEMYENFKEEYCDIVAREMEKKKTIIVKKLEGQPHNEDKQKRMEYANRLPGLFPGRAWYIGHRPKETYPLCNHTTGLCKECEAAN